MTEIEIMKTVGEHPNVIRMVGICSQPQGKPFYLFVEYAKHQNLRSYLHSRRVDVIPYDLNYQQPLQVGFYSIFAELPEARAQPFVWS